MRVETTLLDIEVDVSGPEDGLVVPPRHDWREFSGPFEPGAPDAVAQALIRQFGGTRRQQPIIRRDHRRSNARLRRKFRR